MKKIIVLIIFIVFHNSLNAQWVPLGGALGGDINDLAVFNSNLYAGGTASLFRSTNNGNNWTSHMTIPSYAWYLAPSGVNIYCGVTNNVGMTSGIYKSTNNGLNWSLVGLANKPIFELTASEQELVAIALEQSNFRIFRSTNEGTSWTDITGSLNLGVTYAAIYENRIYAGGQGLHVTTNYGVTWDQLFLTDNIEAVSVHDSLIIIGSYAQGVYRSSNYGQTWERTLNLSKKIRSVYQYGDYVFAAGDTGFYVSTDKGINFTDKTAGLGNASITSIVILNNYVFAANANYLSGNVSAFRSPLQELIGVINISTKVPSGYELNQNYPNPFNPMTNIRFNVPKTEHASITIFDIMGREIAVLVNEQLKPGTYEVTWDGSNFSSGIYYYKIICGNYTDTKKMILLK